MSYAELSPPLLLLAGPGGARLRGCRLGAVVDEGLEVRAWPERRHRGRGDVDRGAGGRVARRAGRAFALLEDAEPGDRDLVAARHGGLDGLEDRVQRLGRGLLVPQATRDGVDQITLVHIHSCVPPRGGCGWAARLLREPLTSPKLGDRALLHNNLGKDCLACRA